MFLRTGVKSNKLHIDNIKYNINNNQLKNNTLENMLWWWYAWIIIIESYVLSLIGKQYPLKIPGYEICTGIERQLYTYNNLAISIQIIFKI